MSEFQTVENKQLIAERVPPGDRWALTADPSKKVYESLTDSLEAYFQKSTTSLGSNDPDFRISKVLHLAPISKDRNITWRHNKHKTTI